MIALLEIMKVKTEKMGGGVSFSPIFVSSDNFSDFWPWNKDAIEMS